MTPPPRLIGLEMSPYSVKVRSYLRFKQIPFEWIDRTRGNEAPAGLAEKERTYLGRTGRRSGATPRGPRS